MGLEGSFCPAPDPVSYVIYLLTGPNHLAGIQKNHSLLFPPIQTLLSARHFFKPKQTNMKKMFIMAACCLVLLSCGNKKKDEEKKPANDSTVMGGGDKKPASELLDLSVADPVKNLLADFAKGDVDGMVSYLDDNVRYTWSGGDSLIGKQAVKDFYKGRWNLIQSINFSNEIVLPIQVNESQQPDVAPPGKWILNWVMTDVTYKNGKNLKFWQHSVNHLNEAGKIDFVGLYIDRQPIMEAVKDLVK